MINWFNRNKQILDEDVINWIFDSYDWAFKQFDPSVFFEETELVLPTNQYFPGEQNSINGMANLIFEQVKQHAGMTHWPTKLLNVSESEHQPVNSATLSVKGQLRGKQAQASFELGSPVEALSEDTKPAVAKATSTKNTSTKAISTKNNAFDESEYSTDLNLVMSAGHASEPNTADNSINFSFHPQQLNSPEGLIAHFAQGLAQHLVSAAENPPPGGKEYLPVATELMGIFMGFGVIFANSAVVPRQGGCGGCGGGQSPVRQVVLNQDEATYALALFCCLKGIEKKQVVKHLKKHLRGLFKLALKDCERRLKQESRLSLSFAS